jgi:DNA gyrase subunit A
MLATKNGLAIRFDEKQVRPIGRTGKGVKGITLRGDDEVIGMEIATDKKSLLTITENGFGKQTSMAEYRPIGRGGIGVINIQCTERNGKVVSVKSVYDDNEIILMSKGGIVIRTKVSGISKIGRNTQGVKLMKLEETDKVSATARIVAEDEQATAQAIKEQRGEENGTILSTEEEPETNDEPTEDEE